jgi:hypothetical protein
MRGAVAATWTAIRLDGLEQQISIERYLSDEAPRTGRVTTPEHQVVIFMLYIILKNLM